MAHAHLVDVAHVEDLQALLVHEALLARVDAADADLAHPLRADRRYHAADLDQRLRAEAAQAGHRHAVHVAAGGEDAGVEVGMGIEPEDAQFLAGLSAMPRHCADAADAQAMVAAEQDRQPGQPEFFMHRRVHRVIPRHDLGQVPVAAVRRLPRVGRADQVAAIDHREAMSFEDRHDAGHPQRLGAHARAPCAGTDVGRRTDEGDVLLHAGAVRCHRRTRPFRWGARRARRPASGPARPPRRCRRGGTAAGRPG